MHGGASYHATAVAVTRDRRRTVMLAPRCVAIDSRPAKRQGEGPFSNPISKDCDVAKASLGTKRICPTTGRKFYDLGKDPVISPYTGDDRADGAAW